MSWGFGVGSVLFAVGALLSAFGPSPLTANVSYAVGAVCFTSAAAVQWRQAADHPNSPRWKDPDWMSAVIQFAGTLEFNVMTLRAVAQTVDPATTDYALVWRPDVVGSAAFLISSWIAWHPIARRQRHELLSGRSGLICWANMLGSIFFAVSAWGSMLLPDGQLESMFWNNTGTFVGALGFLTAAVALRPRGAERTLSPAR